MSGAQRGQRGGERQVEAGSRLAHVGGREIDGDAPRREFKPRVLYRRAYAIARLLDFGFGQTDERKCRQAIGQMRLDHHLGRVHAGQGPAFDDSDRHLLWRTVLLFLQLA